MGTAWARHAMYKSALIQLRQVCLPTHLEIRGPH